MNSKDRNVVIYLAGGAMSSVFAVGVLSKLQKEGVYDRLKAVYAGSAGVMAGAYFLSRQMDSAKQIYVEKARGRLILKKHLPKLLWQLFKNRYIKKVPLDEFVSVVNVDYVIDELIHRELPLDLQKLKNQSVPLFASLMEASLGKVEYRDVREGDSQKVMHAAVNVVPYYYHPVEIDGKKYIDGAIKEPFGIRHIARMHPECKVVMIINEQLLRPTFNAVKGKIEGRLANMMFNSPIMYEMFAGREEVVLKDFTEVKKNPNILLIKPPSHSRIRSDITDKNILSETFDQGEQEAKKILKFIGA